MTKNDTKSQLSLNREITDSHLKYTKIKADKDAVARSFRLHFTNPSQKFGQSNITGHFLIVALKRQCHEILTPFCQSIIPKPLMNALKYF
jgi:hypothetical protein